MKGGKNHVVHVYPDSTSPVWGVMLRIMFHIQSAARQEKFQKSHVLGFFIVVALNISSLGDFLDMFEVLYSY
jgi:hypothetical protein